jgi:hypothetical protein
VEFHFVDFLMRGIEFPTCFCEERICGLRCGLRDWPGP